MCIASRSINSISPEFGFLFIFQLSQSAVILAYNDLSPDGLAFFPPPFTERERERDRLFWVGSAGLWPSSSSSSQRGERERSPSHKSPLSVNSLQVRLLQPEKWRKRAAFQTHTHTRPREKGLLTNGGRRGRGGEGGVFTRQRNCDNCKSWPLSRTLNVPRHIHKVVLGSLFSFFLPEREREKMQKECQYIYQERPPPLSLIRV